MHLLPETDFDKGIVGFNEIHYNDFRFVLNLELRADLKIEGRDYLISNNELDLTAWGNSREEAIDAFNFAFYSLYVNYYNEIDSNLTKDAVQLKNNLHKIIKIVINEAPKN
jgi:hypothetical protein